MKLNNTPVDIQSSLSNQSHHWKEVMGKYINDSVQNGITAEIVNSIQKELKGTLAEAKLALLPIAALYARPIISNFSVGALCEGVSGNFYFGANMEFQNTSLDFTIHAEQASIVNAMSNGESAIRSFTVSAPPCGYCLQLMNELKEASTIDILLSGKPNRSISEYLPCAFGAKDLGIDGGLSLQNNHNLTLHDSSQNDLLVEQALIAANCSYAPYTKNYAGIAIRLDSGLIFRGSYLESAAYNTSVLPVLSAVINLILNGQSMDAIPEVVLIQRSKSPIDLEESTRIFLNALTDDKTDLGVYTAI